MSRGWLYAESKGIGVTKKTHAILAALGFRKVTQKQRMILTSLCRELSKERPAWAERIKEWTDNEALSPRMASNLIETVETVLERLEYE